MAQSSVFSESDSAVSWGAVVAGAVVAAALSLILFLLGSGLGLSSISPWSRQGMDAPAFGIAAIIWITVTQIFAAGMGGYLTGRLRVKWPDVPADEVYFRDTAHGFLSWSVATLATAALLTTTIGAIVSGGMHAATHVTSSAAQTGAIAMAGKRGHGAHKKAESAYFVDALFRKPAFNKNSEATPRGMEDNAPATPAAEVSRILAHAGSWESLPPEDSRYLVQLVAKNTGLTEQQAEQRVSELQAKAQEAETKAKAAADKARKVSIYITLWLFVSLLVGAFSASLAATWGGRCRDA
jgi:hypothetical protein